MKRCLDSEADLEAGARALIAVEPRFGTVLARHGLPPLRRAPEGLAPLLRIVTEQMISLKAAEAIWARIERALPFDEPVRIARMREASLMALGLSGAKARSFKAIAKAAHGPACDFDRFAGMADDDVFAALVAIPGIGPWTAEIYLLANLGRADIWPAGDIALQAAAHDLLGLPERPAPKAMRAFAEPWRPWRAVAARLLWSHYRGLKGLPQAVT